MSSGTGLKHAEVSLTCALLIGVMPHKLPKNNDEYAECGAACYHNDGNQPLRQSSSSNTHLPCKSQLGSELRRFSSSEPKMRCAQHVSSKATKKPSLHRASAWMAPLPQKPAREACLGLCLTPQSRCAPYACSQLHQNLRHTHRSPICRHHGRSSNSDQSSCQQESLGLRCSFCSTEPAL